jgi:membrane-associated phospholipid phosphatase
MKTTNCSLEKISKIISVVFNPIFSLLIFYTYSQYQNPENFSFTKSLLPILLGIILPIFLWIYFGVKKKKYTDSDVSNQKQRNSLYYFIISILTIYQIWEFWIMDRFDIAISCLLLLFIVMMISNFFVKSSMHTAFNLFVAALFFSKNITIGVLWLFITILVAITRIILKRHSTKEIIWGSCIALTISFLYLYLSIFLANQ